MDDGQTVGADGIVHDLWRIQCRQGRPGYGIGPLENEHTGNIAIDEALRGTLGVGGVLAGEAADDHEEGNKEGLREDSGWFASPV